jgi:cobaltochelatase CobS
LSPPVPGEDYEYPEQGVLGFLGLLFSPTKYGLKLSGPEGSGKSSFIKAIHGVLGWPLLIPGIGPSTEESEFRGVLVPSPEGLVHKEGVVLKAMRTGIPVLLDEFNTLKSGVITSLNSVLDGSGMYLPESEEVIMPAAGFKVYATENPADGGLGFHGRSREDESSLARFITVRLEYMADDQEKRLIVAALTRFGELDEGGAGLIAGRMLRVANQVRALWVGNNPDDPAALTSNLSTRALLAWAELLGSPFIGKRDDAVLLSLEMACLNSRTPEFKQSVTEYVKDVFGCGGAES